MASLLQDLRYGLRTLTRTPGFTLIAVTVLALGIGVNATVFSLANAFFLRPLPVNDPDGVVRVYANRFSNVRRSLYHELRDRNSTLDGLAAFQLRSYALTAGRESEHAFGELVTGNYFPLLGLAPARGRLLGPSDDRSGAPGAVVLSHAFWIRRFGASPDAVGRVISLNDVPFTIVGIAPEGFTGVLAPLAGDLWVPLAADAQLRPSLEPGERLRFSMHLVGRLRRGVGRAQAQADLDTIARQVRAAAGEPDRDRAVTVYGPTMLHPEASTAVTAFTAVLMTVVALVLLIVCVNVANLVLARAAARDVELAVRQSLGAGRTRLVRQLLTENLLLSIAGAAGGIALAYAATRFVMAWRLPAPVPIALDLSVDLRVLAFTATIAAAATLAFGMAPALAASRLDLVTTLKGSGGMRPRHSRLRSVFLVAQVAMSILLLVAAGLFIRSVGNAQTMDIGFDTAGVFTASLDLETRGYSAARGAELYRQLSARLEARPGVVSVNVVDIVPLTLSNMAVNMLRDGDVAPLPGQVPPTPTINVNVVGPGHFETLRIPLLAGRDFTDADRESAPRVVIVNETLAERFWPGQAAIGQRLRPVGAKPGDRSTMEIIGLVRDSKYVTVGEAPRPFLYRPLAQQYTPRVSLLVRSAETPVATFAAMKEEVRGLDPGLSLFNLQSLPDAASVSLLPARIAGSLLGALGLLALALAALGIYGVLSFLVRLRMREIGIRVAMGATPQTVAAMVVRQAMSWTAIGAAIGIALALALTRFLNVFLYGISPTDPWTFGAVTLLLGMVACAAAALPAVRASRLDPIHALRSL
jgi:predicted permease